MQDDTDRNEHVSPGTLPISQTPNAAASAANVIAPPDQPERLPQQKDRLTDSVKIATILNALVAVLLCWNSYEMKTDGRQRMQLEQRAWVSATDIASTRPFSRTEVTPVVVKIANSGRTPAKNVRVRVESYYGFSSPSSKDIRRLEHEMTDSASILAANGRFEVPVGADPAKEAALRGECPDQRGPIYFTVYGVIDYLDVFGQSHTTKFCSYRDTSAPPDVQFYNAPEGNTID